MALEGHHPVFLSSIETADLLRLSPRTLESMRREKRGPRYIRFGSKSVYKVLYCLADIEEWIKLDNTSSFLDEQREKDD